MDVSAFHVSDTVLGTVNKQTWALASGRVRVRTTQ